jgi:hypothetical protein
VPYSFKDLEFNNKYTYSKLRKSFDDCEERCAHIFLDNNPDEDGVIGKRSIQGGSWVKRTPSSIYWAGLRKYGIFKGKMSIDQYIKYVTIQKQDKSNNVNLGNSTDEAHDDKNAGDTQKIHYFNIPTYRRDWIDNLNISLTFEEGQFLKQQIIESCQDSLIGHVLKEDIKEFLDIPSFSDLDVIIYRFPQEIQAMYAKIYHKKDAVLPDNLAPIRSRIEAKMRKQLEGLANIEDYIPKMKNGKYIVTARPERIKIRDGHYNKARCFKDDKWI